MTVPTNTAQTYSYTTIREDLSDTVYLISPTETPIMQAVGRKGSFDNKYHEWSTVALAAASGANAVIEGDDATNDAATAAVRLGNYAQLMDKVCQVSSTSQAVKVAGNVAKMAKQVAYKTLELKRDMETRLLANSPAVAGSASVASETAGIQAYLITNTSRGASGANPTLSGSTTGYPNAGATNGTQRAFTEDLLGAVLQSIWEQGGNASLIVVGGFNKRQASAFGGNASRTKDAKDKKIVAAIEIYESDFGTLSVVPSRQQPARAATILDTEMVEIGWLQEMQNTPLAKTGHSDRRMVFAEWGTILGNEKAHGIVADLTVS